MEKIEDNYYYIKLPEDLLKIPNETNILLAEFVERLEKALPPTRCIYIEDNIWRRKFNHLISITPEMIESKAFKVGEQVEVSDDDCSWKQAVFTGYEYCRNKSYLTTLDNHRFCRSIQEPNIEINIKINGKPAKLSQLSLETLKNLRDNN
jgi:hypothetical protein